MPEEIASWTGIFLSRFFYYGDWIPIAEPTTACVLSF